MSSQATNPAEGGRKLTTHPYLGIVGVLLGAMIATSTGRLMSVGLVDLRGALHLGVDEASWLNTTFNASMMFIGPFSVYLGGLLGPRRVLLSCAWIFTAVTFLIPFCHSLPPVIALLIVGGLTAGTFYPLTLTFVLRNLPIQFVLLGIAMYATDIVFTTDMAQAWESFFMEHLSWRWIFWNGTILTPLMILLINFGIPWQPLPKPQPGPSASELERIPVCKLWSCPSVYSSRSRTAARLVPLFAHCRIGCCRSISHSRRSCPSLSPAQSSHQLSISHEEEHTAAGTRRSQFSVCDACHSC